MDESLDELALFDLTRQRLWLTLADRLPPTVGPEPLLTTYAYWMCWRVKQQRARWEETLHEYTDIACRRAADESEAERREIALLRRKLARTRGPLLDVGAGWGRLAFLYAEVVEFFQMPDESGAVEQYALAIAKTAGA